MGVRVYPDVYASGKVRQIAIGPWFNPYQINLLQADKSFESVIIRRH